MGSRGPELQGGSRAPRSLDAQLTWLSLLGGLPAVALSLALLWLGDWRPKVQWTGATVAVGAWLLFALALRERLVRALQLLANLIGGLREGDYSLRGRSGLPGDPLGEAMRELNLLSDTLREQRLGEVEATALLRQVMEEIDVAIVAIDDADKVRLLNPAAEALVGLPAAQVLGRPAQEVGLEALLQGETPRTVQGLLGRGAGRWELRRSAFRRGGETHRLVVLTDLRRALREEERQAWQRLVRVLGHEINNSLTPIQSIATSLGALLDHPPDGEGWREDMEGGLHIIARRSEALARFMASYARLAKLPAPSLGPMPVGPWVERVAALETRQHVQVEPGPALRLLGDGDQLDQLLINLVRNAVDAAQGTGGGVKVTWRKSRGEVEVLVEDEGVGLPASANLFVPFFTTKPGGSGIGLVLSRQIAEAHRGALLLENRSEGSGCRARLLLPLYDAAPA